jgi:hypothetical protein
MTFISSLFRIFADPFLFLAGNYIIYNKAVINHCATSDFICGIENKIRAYAYFELK